MSANLVTKRTSYVTPRKLRNVSTYPLPSTAAHKDKLDRTRIRFISHADAQHKMSVEKVTTSFQRLFIGQYTLYTALYRHILYSKFNVLCNAGFYPRPPL